MAICVKPLAGSGPIVPDDRSVPFPFRTRALTVAVVSVPGLKKTMFVR